VILNRKAVLKYKGTWRYNARSFYLGMASGKSR